MIGEAQAAVRAEHESPHTSPGHSDEIAISARGMEKRFGDVIAVEGANFDIPKGSFVSVVGPSGCGKSTLLRMIGGLIPKTMGSLTVHNLEVEEPRSDVGVMFQRPTLLEWKTALDNVLLPTQLKRKVTAEDTERAMKLLHMAGLKGFEFAFPTQLSGGMQQRVALARLLNIGADILLLDEPFGALDEFTRERLNLELARITSDVQATSVFVTHNIAEAIFLADYVFVMTPRPGRLADIVEVPFPRPREMDLARSPEFNDMVGHVRSILDMGETQ